MVQLSNKTPFGKSLTLLHSSATYRQQIVGARLQRTLLQTEVWRVVFRRRNTEEVGSLLPLEIYTLTARLSITTKYIEGMAWVLHYYYQGVRFYLSSSVRPGYLEAIASKRRVWSIKGSKDTPCHAIRLPFISIWKVVG